MAAASGAKSPARLVYSSRTWSGRGTVDDVIFNALGAAIGGITFFAPRAV
jgi:hypothetical protein